MENDQDMSVGEASVEAAEAAAKPLSNAAMLRRMGREPMDEIYAEIKGWDNFQLSMFVNFLEGETRLCESTETFAGIVLGLCLTEVVERYLLIHGVDAGGVNA